ncbi:hypothetical protein [Streptomyces mayteni]
MDNDTPPPPGERPGRSTGRDDEPPPERPRPAGVFLLLELGEPEVPVLRRPAARAAAPNTPPPLLGAACRPEVRVGRGGAVVPNVVFCERG